MSVSPALRSQVLSLYKRIFRIAASWQAKEPANTNTEREYIKHEARALIEKNKDITDEVLIKRHLLEGEARIEMALHYKNPYPRPSNIPQNVLPPDKRTRKMKARKRSMDDSKPVHIKSYDTES